MLTPELTTESYCYLTTRGRVTGRDHTIEIWFAADGGTVYLLSGGGPRSDWVRNIEADPHVTIRIRDQIWAGLARIVADPFEREAATGLVYSKYQPGYGGDLANWRAAALPVAVRLSNGEVAPSGT